MPKRSTVTKRVGIKFHSDMPKEQVTKEVLKKIKEELEAHKPEIEAMARKEVNKIIWETRAIMVYTAIGVMIGVLTNISAEFFMRQQFCFGFSFLVISLALTLSFFYGWRHYLLGKTPDRILDILSEILVSLPSEIDLTTTQDEEKTREEEK